MDYRKLIEPAIGGLLVGYRRLFSNWVVERQRLIDSQRTFRVHRLATKRIVFEIEGVESLDSRSRFGVRAMLLVALLLTVAGAIGALIASNSNIRSLQASEVLPAKSSASTKFCSEISMVGLTTPSIESFSQSGWTVTTRELEISLGDLQGFAFEATCRRQKLSGRIIALHSVNSWQIKRMVLVD